MPNETAGAVAPLAKKPWAAFNIIERKGLRGPIWSRVGTAFFNQDGSINILLDSFPLGGRLQLREDDREHESRGPRRGTLVAAAESEAGA